MSASWADFSAEAPEFSAYVRSRFDEHGLALLATLTRDGSPRISGIEPILTDEELWLAMMPHSAKGADLRRDGRFALHNATVDKEVTAGDVKISGVAVPVTDRSGSSVPQVGDEADLFRAELTRISSVRVVTDRLAMDTWWPGRGVTQRTRR